MVKENSNSGFNKGLFIGGIIFSIVSPGFLIWWSTIGVSTIVKSLLYGITGLIFLVLGHWAADVIWHWVLSYAVDRGKMYLNDKAYQNILRFFAVLLVAIGLHFLVIH